MKKFLFAVMAFMLFPTFALASPIGTWYRENAQGEGARVEIDMCTQVTYCATIVWMEFPRNDIYNIDPTLRDRPLVGLEIANNVMEVSTDVYSGTIYNPEVGFSLVGTVTQVDNDTLELEGCLATLCQTDTWTRYQP